MTLLGSFENIVRKGDNTGNHHFLLFSQCFFLTLSKTNFVFYVTIILMSENALNLDKSEILSFGKELKDFYVMQAKCITHLPHNLRFL